jgi:aromatic ring hydroxylase-like protein
MARHRGGHRRQSDGSGQAPGGSQWATDGELEAGGAVLVRPDQHVGWRSVAPVASPQQALRDAIAAILDQPVPASV